MNKFLISILDLLITICSFVGIYLLFKENWFEFALIELIQINLRLSKYEMKTDER